MPTYSLPPRAQGPWFPLMRIMKIMFDGTSDYPQGPIHTIDFKDIENDKTNLMFYYGIHPGYRMIRPTTFKYNVYFEQKNPMD